MHSNSDKEWLIGMHLSQLLGLLIPLGSIIGPTAIWLLKRDRHSGIAAQGKQILNFQISFVILSLLCSGMSFSSAFLAGVAPEVFSQIIAGLLFFLLVIPSIALLIIGIGIPILAALKVSRDQEFRYPAIIRPIH